MKFLVVNILIIIFLGCQNRQDSIEAKNNKIGKADTTPIAANAFSGQWQQ